jgi:integral membrane protein
VNAALTRYRVMAWITGVSLLVLVFVMMPLRYLGDEERPSELFSPFHGAMYFLYVLTAFDLVSRLRWGMGRLILIMLAGCIPFVSFYAEHRVTRAARVDIAAREAAEAALTG